MGRAEAEHDARGTPTRPDPKSPAHVALILRELETLPTLSPVAMRLLSASADDEADLGEIIRLLEADPALTGRILSLCRRADRGVSPGVTTVKRAVVLLGLEAVRSAVLSVSIYELMNRCTGESPSGFDRVGFWKHSLATACAAELLAREHTGSKVLPEEAFTAGLVHDLGKLVLHLLLPKAYERVAAAGGSAAAERRLLGLDHHEAGARLGDHWGLPGSLIGAMSLHATPWSHLPDSPARGLVAVVGGANLLSHHLHLGRPGDGTEADQAARLLAGSGLGWDDAEACSARVHEMFARRCADLGIEERTSVEAMLDSIALANARLGTLNRRLGDRSERTRRAEALGRATASFLRIATELASPSEAALAVARSARAVVGADCGVVMQVSSGGPLLWCPANATDAHEIASTTGASLVESLAREDARAVTSRVRAGAGGHVTEAWGMLTVVAGDARRASVSQAGMSAALLHAGTIDREDPWTAALVAAWACGLRCGLRQQGARRLAERLALASRELRERPGPDAAPHRTVPFSGVSLPELLALAVARTRRELESRGDAELAWSKPVRVHVPEGINLVRADREPLTLAVSELVSRALLDSAFARVDLSVESRDPNDRLLIVVRDDGPPGEHTGSIGFAGEPSGSDSGPGPADSDREYSGARAPQEPPEPGPWTVVLSDWRWHLPSVNAKAA
ncbi:MAG: HDOD domain-containing protein [Phycisphaerae bacterium]|nr:HDOD domain-containing protein [Phycisphaerae bacterium]